MYKLLILLLLAFPVWASEPELDWTRRGYFVVRAPDGSFVDRHIDKSEAIVSAHNHAWKSGNTGRLVYTIESPNFDVEIVIPAVAAVEPPEPAPMEPELEDDEGRMLDPCTVFVSDDGEAGGTVEPTGDDSNSGFVDENGNPQPVLTLQRAMRIHNRQSEGCDFALAEGGVWKDQGLTISLSGDIGEENRVVVRAYEAQQAAARPGGADLHKWVVANTPDIKPRLYLSIFHVPGFDPDKIDRVVVHGYKLLNGIPRPLQNPKSICSHVGDHKCYDPFTLEYWPAYWPG